MNKLIVGLIFLVLPPSISWSERIRLFPATVMEDLKVTGQLASDLENNLEVIVARVDQQRDMYRKSKCDDTIETSYDPGCQELRKQMADSYMKILNIMEEWIPSMQSSVQSTLAGLEDRLHNEIGKRQTPEALQETLLYKGGKSGSTEGRPKLRGRSGMRLSQRFQQYHRLVSLAGGQNGGNIPSLEVLAADLYLDIEEASQFIELTRDEIQRAKLILEIDDSVGLISPEMQTVVDGVKTILFGDEVSGDYAEAPAPPPGSKPEEYRSPLEF